MDAILVLEDGTSFAGRSLGASGETIGEVVFNTAMTGYQEVLSDPSYRGQIVVMTYPLIGNYGVNDADVESAAVHVAGFVVREATQQHSGVRAQRPVAGLLKEQGIVGISEVDTRAITRLLRDRGSMMGIVSTEDADLGGLLARVRAAPRIEERDLIAEVATRRPYRFRGKLDGRAYAFGGLPPVARPAARFRLAALDFGLKANIARLLVALGADVTVLPPSTPASRILSGRYDGVVISNGPGDPRRLAGGVCTAEALLGKVPVLGICLGHQILGIALGGGIEKLKFGHHGANHPVKRLPSGKVLITSQNHNYAVTAGGLDAGVTITHRSLNDGCIEGLAHPTLQVSSVQFHPEASPGPHDALDHLASFLAAVRAWKEGTGACHAPRTSAASS